LKSKIREYFNVTDDVLDQLASNVVSEKFKGDSRPKRFRPAGAANVVTYLGYWKEYKDVRYQFLQFQEGVEYSEDSRVVDDSDANSIILDAEDNVFLHSAEGNAAGAQTDKSILQKPDRVRDGHVKKRGRLAKHSQSSLPELHDSDSNRILDS
jgi:hypothetical protein